MEYGQTSQHVSTGKWGAMVTLVLGVILSSGCNTSVTVEGSLPTPVVQKLPLNIGVYYPADFRSFTHQEKIQEQGTWKVAMGTQNLQFFQGMFAAMFDRVTEIQQLELPSEKAVGSAPVRIPENLDGVIVPDIVKYGFLTPRILGQNFFAASIHYRIRIYDKSGNLVVNWIGVGYGKSPGSAFGSSEALGNATTLAIRDGGAKIVMDVLRSPAALKWLKANNISLD